MKKLSYIQGAFVLTATNLITGTLAFVYRIFLSRSIGSEGVGVYQLVMPLYILFITLVSGGITTAVSKLVAEQSIRHNFRNMHKTVAVCALVLGLWSSLLCTMILFNASFLADSVLKDSRTLYSIMVFTPAVLFIALGSVLKGYFYGQQDVNPPAFIDILEKIIRLAGLIITTYYLLPYGIAYICAGAMIAMAVGELISLILLYLCYFNRKLKQPKTGSTEPTFIIVGNILRIAIPLSVSGALHTIMDMVNAVLIPAQLRAAGFNNSNALSLYGELTGMVMPLLFYPFIIVISLGITLVPAITASYASRNWAALNKKCNDSLKITSVIAFASTALFLIFPWELCRIFFKCPEAGSLLFVLAFTCIFEYWQFTLFSILNGIGMQNKVLEYSLINIVITVICAYTLIPMPAVGIYGYIVGFAVSAVFVVLRILSVIKKIPEIRIDFRNSLYKPFIGFIGMYVIIRYCNEFLRYSGIQRYNMTIASISGLVFYFVILLLMGTFTVKQLKSTLSIR